MRVSIWNLHARKVRLQKSVQLHTAEIYDNQLTAPRRLIDDATETHTKKESPKLYIYSYAVCVILLYVFLTNCQTKTGRRHEKVFSVTFPPSYLLDVTVDEIRRHEKSRQRVKPSFLF